jgi:hypothetical protein
VILLLSRVCEHRGRCTIQLGGFDAQMDAESNPRLRVLVSDGPGVRLDEVTVTVAELATMSSPESPRSRTSHASRRPSDLT